MLRTKFFLNQRRESLRFLDPATGGETVAEKENRSAEDGGSAAEEKKREREISPSQIPHARRSLIA